MAKGTCFTCKHCIIIDEKISRITGQPIANGDAEAPFSEGYTTEEVYICACMPMRLKVSHDYYCGQYACDIERIHFQDEDEQTEVVNLTTENLPEV